MVIKPKFYIQSTLDPKIRFEILSRNPTTGETRIQGIGAAFTETLTKDKLAEMKYTVIKEEGAA